jgi:hypothetical protein
MTSIRKTETNRKNGRKGSGPKTTKGKKASSRNSLQHGLFATELVLSETEQEEMDAFSADLCAQLLPTTPLRRDALEQIAFCRARRNLAGTLEMRRLSVLLNTQKQESQTEASEGNPGVLRWYGWGLRDLNEAVGLLARLDAAVEHFQRPPEDLKDPVVRVFGSDFWDTLENWTPANLTGLRMATHLVEHSKRFNSPLPSLPDARQVVPDPEQSLQMMHKLIQQQSRHLQEWSMAINEGIFKAAGARSSAPVEFAPRYFTAATRDLHRAIKWFLFLKTNNL